ncbi:MAG: carboxypeptidase-like regulatory domain-containing protein [Acidobacteria bacterium]|nr:carboxypeptidase-like regulatory domain-containing protein [Acidobacteriota bacterium]
MFVWAEKKPKEKKAISVIAGTVFRDPGFALPGVPVELIEVRAGGKKGKTFKTATDARGEFAFVLPPKEANFRVRVAVKGLAPEEKETSATPGVRTDVYFSLKPAAN